MTDRDAFARAAYGIERKVLGRPGGYQDQYAAAYGGFNFMEFSSGGIKMYPLRLEEDLACEWHSSMMLFETPFPRKGFAHEVERGKDEALARGGEAVERMKGIRDYAYGMKDSLIRGDVAGLGGLLHSSWLEKKELPGVSSPEIDRLYASAKAAGAYGGKLCGAGGGGFLFIVCDVGDRKKVTNALARSGARLVNFDFDSEGMVSWRTGC
jgi:D-glycero-alpha-D-manno-heptose-7-phosphate kinase